MVQSPLYSGISIAAYRQSDAAHFQFSGGALTTRTPYFAASMTRLFVTAILMQLRDEGKIAFDTHFKTYLPAGKLCVEIHVKDGVDNTDHITIRHLMSHTSGFGDSFSFRNRSRFLKNPIVEGIDASWSFEDVISRTRSHGAIEAPGDTPRAMYADVNFHILGKVIEAIEQKNFSQVVHDRISIPLGLTSTYIYNDPSDTRPANFMAHNREINVPRAMASFQADGGLVTNAHECLIFLRSFFEGYLFDRARIRDLYDWKPMFSPMDCGLGVMRLDASRRLALRFRMSEPWKWARKVPKAYGHYGLGGNFAFFVPSSNIYVAGTTNQLSSPKRSLALALRVLEAIELDEVDPAYGRAAQKTSMWSSAAHERTGV
jgi:CubicO group peptidase (beta-lactamase class C family)